MLPIPHSFTLDVLTLSPQALKEKGVRLLLADLDNTLVAYGGTEPSENLHAWKKALEEENITLFILSNSRKPGRVEDFAEKLQVPFKTHAGKPKKSAYRDVLEKYQVKPEECLMVGDQIFTDVLGARAMNIPVILVKPLALYDNFGRILRYYVLETPFRTIGKKRKFLS
ncbi:MAG: YqeG family HAD IIIA-type phosphatase [Eubacteriales bacterium]